MTAPAHKIAVASRDGKLVYHFGQADRFLIFEVDTGTVNYLETRDTLPACDPESHAEGHDQIIVKTADLIADCQTVLVSKIGHGAAAILEEKGVHPVEGSTFIKEAIREYVDTLS